MSYLDMISNSNTYLIFHDLDTLDMYCEYVLNDSNKNLTHTNLLNLHELINRMDESIFITQEAKMARYLFLRFYLEAKIEKGIMKRKLCFSYVLDNIDNRYKSIVRREIMNSIAQDEWEKKEIVYVNNLIFSNLNFVFMHKYKIPLSQVIMDIENNRIHDKGDELLNLFQSIVTDLSTAKRRSTQSNSFNLTDEAAYKAIMMEAHQRLTSDHNFLSTGWQGMNMMLNGGIETSRVYNFIGGTGGFKSGMLLNMFKTVKLNNKLKVGKDKKKRKTILFLSQENNLWETIQRIFNIFATIDNIKNYTFTEVMEMLERGGFSVCLDDEIDLEFRYYGNEDVGVEDLRGMIQEIENEGKEVVLIIQDYIERLRPPKRNSERRIQLADITNQLHDLAVDLDMPIITASQLNRDGIATIEDSMSSNDVAKLMSIGMKNISESFGMLKNLDVNIIIIPVYIESEGKHYLFIRKIKFRGADDAKLDYFFQPFEGFNSKIMLMEDIHLKEPLYKLKFDASEDSSIREHKEKTSVKTRKSISFSYEEDEESEDAEIAELLSRFKAKKPDKYKLNFINDDVEKEFKKRKRNRVA
jgi:RecA/RadA recombinase